MKKVFAVHEGAEIQIGNFGAATPERAVFVPDDVAEQLAGDEALRIEESESAIAAEQLLEGDN